MCIYIHHQISIFAKKGIFLGRVANRRYFSALQNRNIHDVFSFQELCTQLSDNPHTRTLHFFAATVVIRVVVKRAVALAVILRGEKSLLRVIEA